MILGVAGSDIRLQISKTYGDNRTKSHLEVTNKRNTSIGARRSILLVSIIGSSIRKGSLSATVIRVIADRLASCRLFSMCQPPWQNDLAAWRDSASARMAEGDIDGRAVWLRVLDAIKELQSTEPDRIH